MKNADGSCGNFGWTQGIDFFSNTGKSQYNALQAKITRVFASGYSFLAHYTLQSHKNDGDYFFMDPNVDYGPADFIRRHVFVVAGTAELPFAKGNAILGGWQINAAATIQSGLPFQGGPSYRDAGADRDTGTNRPNLIGDPKTGSGDGLTSPYFNVIPIGSPGSAFGRPAKGTFGNLGRNALRGPGWWNVDASLFKRFQIKGDTRLELRVEAQNVFNHINLGNPDAEIGVPGNNNTHAGFISGMAANALPRNLQFALRLLF